MFNIGAESTGQVHAIHGVQFGGLYFFIIYFITEYLVGNVQAIQNPEKIYIIDS